MTGVALYFQYIQYIPVYPVYITKLSAYFTINYLSATEPLAHGFHTQLQNDFPVTSVTNNEVTITTWDIVMENEQFFHQTSGNGDEYSITEPGIYLTSVYLHIYNFTGMLKVEIKLKSVVNKGRLTTVHYCQNNKQYTASVTGVISMDKSDVFSISVYSDNDLNFEVKKSSTRSLVLLGSKNHVRGFSATLKEQISKTYYNRWSELSEWITAKYWSFQKGSGFENKKSYTIQENGFFFISVNLVCKNGETSPEVIEIAIKYNNILTITNGLYDRKQLKGGNNGYATLQINCGMYLSRWDILQPYFKVQSTSHNIILEEVSTFSIVKIGMNYYF